MECAQARTSARAHTHTHTQTHTTLAHKNTVQFISRDHGFWLARAYPRVLIEHGSIYFRRSVGLLGMRAWDLRQRDGSVLLHALLRVYLERLIVHQEWSNSDKKYRQQALCSPSVSSLPQASYLSFSPVPFSVSLTHTRFPYLSLFLCLYALSPTFPPLW